MTIKNDLQMDVSVPNEDVEKECDTLWDERSSPSTAAAVFCISFPALLCFVDLFIYLKGMKTKVHIKQTKVSIQVTCASLKVLQKCFKALIHGCVLAYLHA